MNSTLCCSVCFRAFLFTAPPRKPLSPVRVSTRKSRHISSSDTKRDAPHTAGRPFLVEVTGLEPTTSWSLTKRATKLRYTSMKSISYYINNSRRVKRFFTPACKKFAQITKISFSAPHKKRGALPAKKKLRDGPVSRVLSSAVIYLRLPSPISSSGIHGCTRAGNPYEYSPTLHRTGFTWHGALPSRR